MLEFHWVLSEGSGKEVNVDKFSIHSLKTVRCHVTRHPAAHPLRIPGQKVQLDGSHESRDRVTQELEP